MQTYPVLDSPTFLSSIFYPRPSEPTPLPEGAVDLTVGVEPGIQIACRLHMHALDNPNILFFHGNGETISDYDDIGPLYKHVGINLLVVDYRGYGWSNGSPTVASMIKDAEILFSELKQWLQDNKYTGDFFIMGRSLGSVPAIDLASKQQDNIKGLILESAIANTIPLASTFGVNLDGSDFTEKDGFQNIEKIEKITIPTFIIHGAQDEIIPAVEAEKLQSFSGARTKEFVVIPGATHNTMIVTGGKLYFQIIKQFIDKITGATNWRRTRNTSTNSSSTE